MSKDDEVRAASTQFYAALNRMANGDASQLSDIWSQTPGVTSMHPIGGREVGWEAVRGSFAKVAQIASAAKIRLDDQIITVVGDLAYELGNERGPATFAGTKVDLDHRVTNVYRREAAGWKIVHHHTDVVPAMVDIVSGLQSKK